MRTPYDPYSPISFPDGRVFVVQTVEARELCETERIYRVTLDLMERATQHLHCVEVTVYWGEFTGDHRRASGEMLLYVVRESIKPEMDTWRYPERLSSYETAHKFEIGKAAPPPI